MISLFSKFNNISQHKKVINHALFVVDDVYSENLDIKSNDEKVRLNAETQIANSSKISVMLKKYLTSIDANS